MIQPLPGTTHEGRPRGKASCSGALFRADPEARRPTSPTRETGGFMSALRLCSMFLILLSLGLRLPAEETQKAFDAEITVTATASKEAEKDLPAPLRIISADEIQDSQQSDLPALLRRVPGIIVMQSGGSGSVASVFSRGSESDHTLVMIDGVRLNSPYFGGYDFSQLSTAGLERIEVIRGPYSALWGSDAIGGVINLVPQRGKPGFHGEIFAEGGSDSWERYEGSLSYSDHGFDLYATGLERNGHADLDNSDFDLDSGMIDAGWSFDEKGRIGVLFHQLDSDLGIPFTSPGNLSPLRRQKAQQTTLAFPMNWKFSPAWSIEFTASRVEREFRFSDPDDPWGFSSQSTDADTSQIRALAHHNIGDHALIFGSEWRTDEVDDVSSYGINLESREIDTTSLFAQDDWQISPKARLLLSARLDDTETWGSQFSPRLSFGWSFDQNLGLRISYGEAFRQPSLGELYFPGSGNPKLKPESSKSYEINFISRPSNKFRSRYQLNYFHTDIIDLMNFDFVSYRMENIGQARIDGLEFIIDTEYSRQLSSTIQLSWLNARDGSNKDLLRRPEWSGSWSLHGAFTENLRGDLAVVYVGERPDIDAGTYLTVNSAGFITVDLALSTQLSPSFTLQLRGTNLLNRNYSEINGYPSPGRRVMGGLRASF